MNKSHFLIQKTNSYQVLKFSWKSVSTHLYDWIRRWNNVLIRNGVPPGMMVIGSPRRGELKEHVCESCAVVSLLVSICMAEHSRPSMRAICMRYLESLVRFNLGTPSHNTEITGQPTLRVHQNGLVEGSSPHSCHMFDLFQLETNQTI